jgi:hypothetical protein
LFELEVLRMKINAFLFVFLVLLVSFVIDILVTDNVLEV